MLPRLYAELLVTVVRGRTGADADKRIKHVLSLIRSRGHEKLLPRIVREVERSHLREGRRRGAVLKIAEEHTTGKFKAAARKILADAGKKEVELREEVDEKLIRGFSIEGSDFTYDVSARRQLIALFETLTT